MREHRLDWQWRCFVSGKAKAQGILYVFPRILTQAEGKDTVAKQVGRPNRIPYK